MRLRPIPLCGLLAGLIVATSVHAGRPLQTEDAGVLDARECELELAWGRERERGAPPVRADGAQLGCGIGLNSQVALFAGRTRSDVDRSEELALVGKSALRRLTDDDVGVLLAWAVAATRPDGQGFRHDATEIKAVVTQPVGPWLMHANLGGSRSQGERLNTTLWSLAAERTGLGPVDAMAEVFGDDRSDPWLNAGLRWTAIEGRLAVDGSHGVQMNSRRARVVTVGLKLSF